MKIKHLLLLLASAAFVALSCEKNDENKPDDKDTAPVPEISVLTTAFPSIADEGGTLKVTISSNVDWTLSIPEAASWLSADAVSGAAGDEIIITFTAEANDTPDRRTATVTVSAENKKGSDSEEFTVSQQQKDAILLTEDVIEVSYEGEIINIAVKANVEVSYTIAEAAQSWIVPVEPNNAPTRALVEFTYSFEVLANPVKEVREGVITFTSAAGDETVTVKQEALPEPDPELAITPASIPDVKIEGDTVVLALTSNMPWTVALADGVDWVIVSPSEGEAGEDIEVTVTILGHDANDGRTTDLTFTCTNAENESKDVIVKVSQKGHNIPSKIFIKDAEDLIQFATDFNNKHYELVLDSLTVTLSDDITFDAESSAAYDATGGIGNKIGEETNYFHGVFDGADHTIHGYTGSSSLFAYTGGAGTVKNIIIAADCAKIIDAENTNDLFGAFVAYHKGVLQNCVSHANLTFSNVATKGHFYGGLVGRCHGGVIKDCTMDGDILCPAAVTLSATGNQGIGGIAGRANKVDYNAKIENCHFNGNITVSDNSEFGGIKGVKGVNFFIGGIVGHIQDGSIIACDTKQGKTMDIRGTFNAYAGGIAGWTESGKPSTISNCTNNMSVKFSSDGDRSVITPTVLAGIVGHGTDATVSGCVNRGEVVSTCNANLLYIGGIAAMADDSSFDKCSNEGNLTHTNQVQTAEAARYISMAGIAAIFTVDAKIPGSVSFCSNSGKVICNQLGISKNTTVDMGGIVGKNDATAITITNCENLKNGLVQATDAANKTAFARTAMGGILGYSHVANTVIRGCYNYAKVFCQYTKGGTSDRPSYVGGIAGFLGIADKTGCSGLEGLEIDNCHSNGCVHNQNYNNTLTLAGAPIQGGIVGAVLGTSDKKASIHDCTTSSPTADSLVTALRGISGGIVGYAEQAVLTNNVSSTSISGNTNATGAGGVAGWTVNTSLSNCTYSGTIGPVGTNVAPKNVGGLVYLMGAGSAISACKVDGASLSKGNHADATAAAVLVSNAASGVTIANCGVKGTLEGVAITLGSNMITTDGGADVSGTYLITDQANN